MRIFPIILILIGVLIITNPDIIAYIIGYLLVISGIFGVITSLFKKRTSLFKKRKEQGNDSVWNMGSYEIIKRKK